MVDERHGSTEMIQLSEQRQRDFIIWAQRNACLLCKYPLDLHKHFHHVIAREDGGPDHYLNLIALCPNHHWLVERIKRHIIPAQHSQSASLLKAGTAALQLYNELDEQTRRTLDVLSMPHQLSGVVQRGVPKELTERAAQDLMMEDAKLLYEVNSKRPRIFLSPESCRLPDEVADGQAEKMATQKSLGYYSEVITAHMQNLHLPYKAIAGMPNDLMRPTSHFPH